MARNEIRPIVKPCSTAGTGYTYVNLCHCKNRHNDPVIRRQPTSARPLHHQGLGRAGVHEPGASDTVGDLTHCSVPMQRVAESLAVELPQDRWLTCPHRRYAPHATEQTRLAEVVSGTESKDDLPSTSASSSPDSMTKKWSARSPWRNKV